MRHLLYAHAAQAASKINFRYAHDRRSYKFTAKEQDEETGLYYYGARYLDAKYSRWLSADPAVGDYIPMAPVNDEARKHNQQLPGMGGVFNVVNFQLYHYAGNNPVKYVDPTGRQTKDSKLVFVGKGNIIGYGYINSTMGGSLNQSKDFLFKNFVFEYMTLVPDENFDSQLKELKKQSGQTYSDRSSGEVTKYTEFSRAIFADEITYDDLEFSKSTGGYIFFSEDSNPDSFSGDRPRSFLFISKEVDIYIDVETNEVFIFNAKKEVLQIE
nr:RHS repeat-associated core domain-containing protein [Treponema socranskii]